jgi:hypothetical protein
MLFDLPGLRSTLSPIRPARGRVSDVARCPISTSPLVGQDGWGEAQDFSR